VGENCRNLSGSLQIGKMVFLDGTGPICSVLIWRYIDEKICAGMAVFPDGKQVSL